MHACFTFTCQVFGSPVIAKPLPLNLNKTMKIKGFSHMYITKENVVI
jgi:hypothetical protein